LLQGCHSVLQSFQHVYLLFISLPASIKQTAVCTRRFL
jgi:hypothetical protein